MRSTSEGITLREARELPLDILARRVLGAAGRLVAEVERPSGESGPFAAPGLRWLTFASRPRSAGFAGICEADLFLVSFEPIGKDPPTEDTPSRVQRLDTSTVYAIVGHPSDRDDGGDSRDEARCGRSDAVLRSDPHIASFFGGSTEGGGFRAVHASLAARALDRAIRLAKRGELGTISCTEDSAPAVAQICSDPRAYLAALSPAKILFVEIGVCRGRTGYLCVAADFPREAPKDDPLRDQRQVTVTVRIKGDHADPPLATIAIDGVDITGHTIVS
ncbi:MAG TPA: hypothetical protein VFW19_01680 [Allosphingosinicella sp.]|nr:hypothetical protein [Allosphingosinicella sp.]